jgi:hypothetical protein
VARLSLTVYEQLQPLGHGLFVLDKHASIAIGNLRNDRETAVEALGSLIDDVNDVQDRLPAELNRIMKLAESTQLNRTDLDERGHLDTVRRSRQGRQTGLLVLLERWTVPPVAVSVVDRSSRHKVIRPGQLCRAPANPARSRSGAERSESKRWPDVATARPGRVGPTRVRVRARQQNW